MNRAQFFNTVKLARVPVSVIQDGDKGYKLVAGIQHEGEDRVEIGLLYKNEPRYFKSLNSVGEVMREYDVHHFTVEIVKQEVKTVVRGPRKAKTTETPAAAAENKPKGSKASA